MASSGTAQVAPHEVEIIKQINRVNEDGSYTFGYEAADGSFKIETRDVLGNVKGMFGFVDENGELKRVSYTANNGTGYRATGDVDGEASLSLSGYTTEPPEGEVTRRPVLVLRQPGEPSRAPVIQHIPRRLVHSTTPSYGEYLKGRRPHTLLSTKNPEETTPKSPEVKEEPEADEPTQIPLRKLLVTKRPLSKGGNNLRRQLGNEPDGLSGDVSDVYSGGVATPRYVPVQSLRSPQSPLLANLPPHVANAIRQQQIARAAAALRSYSPGVEGPIPSSRPGIIDEQEYPPVRNGRTNLPPVRPLYRPADVNGPPEVSFPMASLRSLRDELMDYILQYLQFRLGGGGPVPFNPYALGYQNQNLNPNFPYQNPINFQGVNPNLYNPYYYPNAPFMRGPYQPPFAPVGYPQVGYPPVGYPGQGFPQPLPFSSPNKQQAAQQYGPSQRSAPSYNQFQPSPRQGYDGQTLALPSGYDNSAQRSSSGYEQAETRGTSDQNTYSVPPADVLRMMLARGLAGAQTSTTTSTTPAPGPVRNVQILGAASSMSSTTVRPPAPVDEMQMQA